MTKLVVEKTLAVYVRQSSIKRAIHEGMLVSP